MKIITRINCDENSLDWSRSRILARGWSRFLSWSINWSVSGNSIWSGYWSGSGSRHLVRSRRY